MRERALLIVLTLLCVGCSGGSLKVSPTTWLEVQLGEFDGLRIGQGSSVTYIVQPLSRQSPTCAAAAVNASISAWAVGSLSFSRWLYPRPMMRPADTTTAPMGISSSSAARSASRSAARMNFSSTAGSEVCVCSSVIPEPAPSGCGPLSSLSRNLQAADRRHP